MVNENINIFDLTKEELSPIIENIAGETIESYEIIKIEHDIKAKFYGISGDKVIATFSYVTQSKQLKENTVFVKQFYEPSEEREAWHYSHLSKLNALIPICYGSLRTAKNEREIIFLEYINPVPDYRPYNEFLMDKKNLASFVKISAQFDAIIAPDEYAEKLAYSSPHGLYDESISCCIDRFNRLWEDADSGRLGDALQKLCTDKAFNQISKLAERIADIKFLPSRHLVHDCYEPCHTGWRIKTGEMLVFDLQGIELGPRFSNGGICIGQPDEIQNRCYTRQELAGIYLKEYTKYSDENVSLDQFLMETRNIWLCEAMWLLDLWRRQILEDDEQYKKLLFNLVSFLINIPTF
jgi:hypothetical protein